MGKRGRKPRDLTGQQFGRWTVLRKAERPRGWECQCGGCGVVYVVSDHSLLTGGSTQCRACADQARRHAYGGASFSQLYAIYRQGAQRRALAFELTPEAFMALVSQPCHYCGIAPQQTICAPEVSEAFTYNGLDRLDNAQGYTIANCAPCCWACNRAKGVRPYAEFTEWLRRIAAHVTNGGL